jgi:hypothetical protein
MQAHSENGEGGSESNKISDGGSTRALNRSACIAQIQRAAKGGITGNKKMSVRAI